MKQTNSIQHFEKMHRYYEKKAYNQLIKDFRVMFRGINYDRLNLDYARATIALNVNETELRKTLFKVYLTTGLHYGKLVVKDIELEKKSAPYPLFSEAFQLFIANYFKKEGLALVTTLTDTMINAVVKVVEHANLLGLTQSQVTGLIKKTVNSPKFYRWQAMRIARTESLFAMNSAKITSFEESSIKMAKVWIQGGSKHPRNDHSAMNGTQIESNSVFTLPNGERCLYPGDKSLSASQVVNCSCTIAYKPMRDNNGKLIYK